MLRPLLLSSPLAILLAACVPFQLEQPPSTPGAKTATATPIAPVVVAPTSYSLETATTTQYLVVKAEQTGLVNSADDGTYMYFAFRSPPGDVLLFDQDGQPLEVATTGVVAGVQGLHQGVLIKRGAENSYVTPNPRAKNAEKPALATDPQVAAVTRKLDAAALAMPAFKRALEMAEGRNRNTSERERASMPVGAITMNVQRLRSERQEQSASDPTYMLTANGPVVRVFFATGGRAVVAPDDGLARLEAEAQNARTIRITGYTDSVGSAEANASLARSRAEAIRYYLIARGVLPSRIAVSWAPNNNYLSDNETARGRAMNRRAEILFIKDRTGPQAVSQVEQRR